MAWGRYLLIIASSLLMLSLACSRQPTELPANSTAAFSQASSFTGHGPEPGKVSPTEVLTNIVIPRGSRIVVRLQSALSSSGSRAGDLFSAVLDKAIIVRGETIAPAGAMVSGRVVAVSERGSLVRPGYLQITLTSLNIGGRNLTMHTSAVFAKSASQGENSLLVTPAGEGKTDSLADKDYEIKFSTGRQLVFWLVQALPVPG
jgi:hypothetical protein